MPFDISYNAAGDIAQYSNPGVNGQDRPLM
jgi:hypothetical protein